MSIQTTISDTSAESMADLLTAVRSQTPYQEYSYLDGDIQTIRFPFGYVSDYISNSHLINYFTPSCYTALFLSTPTGSGKTTFVFNTVLPYVKEKGGRLAILCSRTALKNQYQLDAAKREDPELLKTQTSYGLKKLRQIGNVDIFTYQEFFELAQIPLQGNSFSKKYKAVIFDEAHFFVQDASFNCFTLEILEMCLRLFKHCPRFYLTATPEICLSAIVEAEFSHRSCILPYTKGYTRNRFYLIYMEKNYEYIDPCFFKEDSEIIELIKKDTSSCKYLICVDSKKKGLQLEAALGEDIADYIDAEAKNSAKADTVDNMVSSGRFDSKVLIATSFLDVGINLTDIDLTKIVVYSTNITHFIQSIGRKRKAGSEKINLYIKVPSTSEIKNMLKAINEKIYRLSESFFPVEKKFYSNICFPYYCKSNPENTTTILCNSLYQNYLDFKKHELEDLLSCADSQNIVENGLALCFLKWLNLNPDSQLHWLGISPDDKDKCLTVILDKYINKVLSKDELYEFLQEFAEAYAETHEDKIFSHQKPNRQKIEDYIDKNIPSYRITHTNTTPRNYEIKKG